MIEFLDGRLESKQTDAVTVSVGGVGFLVYIPLSTFDALPPQGDRVRLLTHLYVREDDMSLFGFASDRERRLFRMLVGVSGISTTIALRALSACSVAEFKRMILDEEADALRSIIKGVGTKTARRMVLELQEPIQQLAVEAAPSAAHPAARDAVEALVKLGESRADAERAVRAVVERLGPDIDEERLVAEALSG